jgi:cytochrome c5
MLVSAALLSALGCGAPEIARPVAATSAAVGSDGAAGAATPSPSGAVAALHRTRCGQCHVRVEPGTRSRAALTEALNRHRKRARLGDDDVRALVDYLAP